MMARTVGVVMLAAVIGGWCCHRGASTRSGGQPAASRAATAAARGRAVGGTTVQAGDTRPIHVCIRGGLKSHGGGAHELSAVRCRLEQAADRRGRARHRRLVSLSDRAGAGQYRCDRDVPGRRRLHDRVGEARSWRTTSRGVAAWISIHDTLCGDDPQYFEIDRQ